MTTAPPIPIPAPAPAEMPFEEEEGAAVAVDVAVDVDVDTNAEPDPDPDTDPEIEADPSVVAAVIVNEVPVAVLDIEEVTDPAKILVLSIAHHVGDAAVATDASA